MDLALFPSRPVLIVDDETRMLQSIAALLRTGGVTNALRCEDSREALGILESRDIDVVLLDLRMPHLSGEDLLARILEQHPEIPVIMITGINDLETAVRCMRAGAYDYMVKPVEEQRLISGVKRAIEFRELRSENSSLRARFFSNEVQHPEAFAAFLSGSPKIDAVFRYAETVARSLRPVLITGETGVGKELIARALHTLSERKGRFVAVNLAGLDDAVFADTLFGHVPGAFTGADLPRAGLLEQAAGGTLFLDEIGDLRAESQVKLLRFLQEQEFFPLGADLPKRAEVRILVATHRNLDALVESGSFRRDLFFRLQVHRIHIPPLRERLGDIPLLLHHFLEQAARSLDKPVPLLPKNLLLELEHYSFPGNVRELEAMVFDAVAKCQGRQVCFAAFQERLKKHPEHRTESVEPPVCGQGLTLLPGPFPTLAEGAEFLVTAALRRSGGNQTLAAALLGITPSALNKRLKRAHDLNIS